MATPKNTEKSKIDPGSVFSRLGATPIPTSVLLIGLSALWLYVAVSLITYSPDDPAITNQWVGANASSVSNWGGRIGAMIADFLRLIWGWSVWVLMFAGALALGRRVLSSFHEDWVWQGGRSLFQVKRVWPCVGLTLLMLACSAAEWFKYAHGQTGPLIPAGGVVGFFAGSFLLQWFGSTGMAMICLLSFVAGSAIVFGISWGGVAQWTGEILEKPLSSVMKNSTGTVSRGLQALVNRLGDWWYAREQKKADRLSQPAPQRIVEAREPKTDPAGFAIGQDEKKDPGFAQPPLNAVLGMLNRHEPVQKPQGLIEPKLHQTPTMAQKAQKVQEASAMDSGSHLPAGLASEKVALSVSDPLPMTPAAPPAAAPAQKLPGNIKPPMTVKAYVPQHQPIVAEQTPATDLDDVYHRRLTQQEMMVAQEASRQARHTYPSEAAVTAPVTQQTGQMGTFEGNPRQEEIKPDARVAEQQVIAPSAPIPRAPVAAAALPPSPQVTTPVAPPVIEAPVAATPVVQVTHGMANIEQVRIKSPQSVLAADDWQKPPYQLPDLSLLDPVSQHVQLVSEEHMNETSRSIESNLKNFGVEVSVKDALSGPVVTRYEVEPATGVKGSQVVNLAKDLARSLALVSVRVVETIPGKNLMALELPNAKRQMIRFSEIIGSSAFQDSKSLLTMGLGKSIIGEAVVADLAKMPHVLVAGTTGSGKSVGINGMILSLLYKASPDQVKLMMIDPKMLEMSIYEGIPHLLCPVVTDMKHASNGLNWCVEEMERRYRLMSKLGVRNLAGYNTKIQEARDNEEFIYNPFSLTPEDPEPLKTIPHIVIVIDELADLMMVVGKKIEELIARLAQKARAAGIHLVLATQRPSVDVITGLIKANIPTRIAFQVSSKIDSRTVLDQMGAEALLGMGDMLYMPSGSPVTTRVHGAFVSDEEVHRVVEFLKSQGEAQYVDGILDSPVSETDAVGESGGGDEMDPMYDQAVEIVLKDRKASISYIQRKLRIGYNRSANLLEEMEKARIVSSPNSQGQREILAQHND